MHTSKRLLATICLILLVVLGIALPANGADRFRMFPVTGTPSRITAGPDGNLWFTERVEGRIGRITPSGVISEFPVPGGDPWDIAPGPDGNVWFTELAACEVGRITPDGTITEFPVPGPAPIEGIVAGPDGDLWFAENWGRKIARLALDGSITEFPTEPYPETIAVGADGNLWHGSAGWLVQMTTSGEITTFPLPNDLGNAMLATSGTDGNVWFVRGGYRGIGKITPDGAITEYLMPYPRVSRMPNSLAAGPDGNLWFTEQGRRNWVGWVTPSGTMSEFPVSESFDDVTLGPDGNLWFASAESHLIARMLIASADTKYALVGDYFFSPACRTVRQGQTMRWIFLGPNAHSVTDSTGMGLFDSGVRSLVDYYSFGFFAAGRYPYESTTGSDAMVGTIKVPAVAPSTISVGVPFTVTWSSAAPPVGYVFDVLVKSPADTAWQNWLKGATALGADYTAPGPGTYRFKARLRNATGHSSYSPPKTVVVS
jgi:streptogramin lyase